MMPKTRDELKACFREVLHEEFELIGLDMSTQEKREIIRDNFKWLGKIKGVGDSIASKIGWAIIGLFCAGVAAILAIGSASKFPIKIGQ